jgi:hypothetical protein
MHTRSHDIEQLDENFAMECARETVEGIKRHAEPTRISLTFSSGNETIENTNGLSAYAEGTSCVLYA